MSKNLNPYDYGWRLEPRPWVRDGMTGQESSRPATPDDYGRVDFEDDEGTTIFTGWINKTSEGYTLRIDEHHDVALKIETSSDRHVREAAMQQIDQELGLIAETRPGALVFFDDGDVDAFAHGNYQFIDERDDRNGFYVTEEYEGTNPGEDPDAIPDSWVYRTEAVQSEEGQLDRGVRTTSEGRVDATNLNELFDAAKAWVNALPVENEYQTTEPPTIRQLLEADGVTYPHSSWWDALGSSEKDLWEERQMRALQRRQQQAAHMPPLETPTSYPSM